MSRSSLSRRQLLESLMHNRKNFYAHPAAVSQHNVWATVSHSNVWNAVDHGIIINTKALRRRLVGSQCYDNLQCLQRQN